MSEKRDLVRDVARQLNLNPDHEHIAHQIHDTITLLKDAAHQLKQRREIEAEALICDFCHCELTNPWHGSGIVDGKERRHLHACDGCRDRLPDRAAHQAAEPVLEVRHGAMGCVDWIAWPQEFPTGTKLYAVPAAPQQVVEQGKIIVSTEPLRQVLHALIGAPHLIRELQVTREPASLFKDNPINVLVAEFNAFASSVSKEPSHG